MDQIKDFISLEEFLILPESQYETPPRPYHFYETGWNWLNLYHIARSSYLRFGDQGPPVGSIVKTLTSGHGGGAGIRKKFNGVYQNDSRFFELVWERSDRGGSSLVEKCYWWREIQLAEPFSEVLKRTLDAGIITRQSLKEGFPSVTDELIEKWLAGQFLHWYSDDMIRSWFRTRGVLC